MTWASKGFRGYVAVLLIITILGIGAAAIVWHFIAPSFETTQRALWSYEDEVLKQTEKSRAVRPETIFIGDSLIAKFPVSKISPYAENYGIAGDTIDGLLVRTPGYDFTNAKAVILEIGINNWQRDGLRGFNGKYRRLLAALPPSVLVITTAITPVSNAANQYFDVAAFRAASGAANRDIQEACRDRANCRFVDLAPMLTDRGGALRPEYSEDGLHLSPAGYAVWIAELRKAIR